MPIFSKIQSGRTRMKSIVMASGFGTRLRTANVNKPKGLLKYKGKPLINHIIDKIPQEIQVIVNTNKKFEADFRRWEESLGRKVTLCAEPVSTEKETSGALGSINYWIEKTNIRGFTYYCQ